MVKLLFVTVFCLKGSFSAKGIVYFYLKVILAYIGYYLAGCSMRTEKLSLII
jgi:hypothetical protein